MAISPLKLGTKNQAFLENVKSAVKFRLIDLILAMAVCLPVQYSHCTKGRFSLGHLSPPNVCDSMLKLRPSGINVPLFGA